MIDLHMHSLFSDGVLLPSELVRRAYAKGFDALAITDHVDFSNVDWLVPNILKASQKLSSEKINVIPGVEITHVPPDDIKELVTEVRQQGIKLVVVHGETIVEPVAPNTNRKALEADVDIIAHPGLITEEEVMLAKENGICLEITTRKGHSLTNGHVAKLAKKCGTKLVINTDTHTPVDIGSKDMFVKVALGAGIDKNDVEQLFKNAYDLVKKLCS